MVWVARTGKILELKGKMSWWTLNFTWTKRLKLGTPFTITVECLIRRVKRKDIVLFQLASSSHRTY